MVNRGWVFLSGHEWDDATDCNENRKPLNIYHWYFSNHGIRRQLLDWEDLACSLLLHLQQEVLMTEDQAARDLLDELLKYPDIPADWPQRGAAIPYAQSFKIQRRSPEGHAETFIAISTTIGATSYVPRPRLILSALHPLHPEHWVSREQIAHLSHSRLFTQ